jgi:outer membrane lipoprotein-sorting protein
MVKRFLTCLLVLLPLIPNPGWPSERAQRDRIFAVAQRMEAAFKELADYTCEVNQIYYRNGEEDQIYRFKFFFKKEKKIRIDFSQPYPAMSIIYHGGEDKATVVPFRSTPKVKFHFSIESSLIKTPAGQRVDQTDIGHFIHFLLKNLRGVEQKEAELEENGEKVAFTLWAFDYIEERIPEKYRISISKKNWLPNRIDRYRLDGKPIEITHILNYSVNSRLEDKIFNP